MRKYLRGLLWLFFILFIYVVGQSIGFYLLEHLYLFFEPWLAGHGSLFDEQMSLLIALFARVFSILVLLGFIRWGLKGSWQEYGLGKKNFKRDYAQGLMIGTLLYGLIFGLIYLFDGLSFVRFQAVNPWLLLLTFLGFLIQGFEEELLVRGIFQTVLEKHLGQMTSIFLPSFLFASLHLLNDSISWLSFFNTFLIGLIFALLVSRSNNLWMASGLHGAWNFVQSAIFGVAVSGMEVPGWMLWQARPGQELMTGGSYGTEASVFTTLVLSAYAVYLWIDFRRQNETEQIY